MNSANQALRTEDLISPEMESMVRDLGIPPCPAVLTDFMAEMRRDEPDMLRISHLIGKDAAIAGSLLKIVNSPLYGLRTKATTIRQALTMLGLRTAANVVAGLMLRQAFPASRGVDLQDFWDASSRIALLTAYLARELEVASLDAAHTFALFRDCGVPVLIGKFPDYRKSIATVAPHLPQDVTIVEQERYGVDHAEASAALARGWQLDELIWIPIACHHALERHKDQVLSEMSARMIAVALLAERTYRAGRSGNDPAAALQGEEALLSMLQVDSAQLDDALCADVRKLLWIAQ